MSCSLKETKRRSYYHIKNEIIKDTDSINWVTPSSIEFGYGTKNVPEQKNALRHAQRKQKAIQEWAKETFGAGFSTGWSAINTGAGKVIMDLSFPPNLAKAWERKLELEQAEEVAEYQQEMEDRIQEHDQLIKDYGNQFFYNGELYPTAEDMNAAIEQDLEMEDDMTLGVNPSQTANKLNLPYLIGTKKAQLKRINAVIQSVKSQRNSYMKDAEMRNLLTKQERQLNDVKTWIEKQIKLLDDGSLTVAQRVNQSVMEDFKFVDELLSFDDSVSRGTKLANMDLAKDMIHFYERISRNTVGNDNKLLPGKKVTSDLEEDIQELLQTMKNEANKRRSAISKFEQDLLREIIESDPAIQKVYLDPNGNDMTAEEILTEMLAAKEDIDRYSQQVQSLNKTLAVDDGTLPELMIIHLRNKINDKRHKVLSFKQRIDALHDDVKKELLKLNQNVAGKVLGKFTSEVSFDIFFRKGLFGRTGHIIDVYSGKWHEKKKELTRIYEVYKEGLISGDQNKIRDAVKRRQNWLFGNTNMVDITRLPEIIADSRFSKWSSLYQEETSEDYKKELINKIGKQNYNKIVNQQTKLLDDFLEVMDNKYASKLKQYQVGSFDELPVHAQAELEVFELSRDPFRLLESLKGDPGNYGKIPYKINTNSSNNYESHVLYNAYYPKDDITVVNKSSGDLEQKDSGFYDENFKQISDNETLMQFWEVLRDSNEFMLQILSQSGTFLSEGSLIFHQKNIAEIILSKNSSTFRDGGKYIFNAARNAVASIFGAKVSDQIYTDKVNKGNINTIQEKVSPIVANEKIILENIMGSEIKKTTMLALDKVKPEIQDYFIGLLKVNSIDDVIAITGKHIRPSDVISGVVTEKVMQEQTMNLPLLMKAYLDIVAEYGGRQDALPLAKMFKDVHMGIEGKDSSKNKTEEQEEEAEQDSAEARKESQTTIERSNSKARMKDAFEKLVLNRSKKQTGPTSDKLKFYNSYESGVVKEINKQLKNLKKSIEDLNEDIKKEKDDSKKKVLIQKVEMLNGRISQLEDRKKYMGYVFSWASTYESFISKAARFRALGYSVSAPLKNMIEGTRNAVIFDSGNYATPGNILTSMNFYYRGAFTRYVSPSMAKQKGIVNLIIQNMNLIQNGANEFEKNSRKTGAQSKMSWFKPFKGTEVAETNIQTPEILAMLMDERISYYDEFGNEHLVPVFDGNKFPAHDIIDGRLVLKEKYRKKPDGTLNTEQISMWENFNGDNYNRLKTRIDNNIAEINGAYDEFATMMAKNNVVAGSLLTFKTWVPNYLYTRFAKNQRIVSNGKSNFSGYYRRAMMSENPKANFAGLTGAATNMVLQALNKGTTGILKAGAIAGGASALGFAGTAATATAIGAATLGLAFPAVMLGVGAYQLSRIKKESGEHVAAINQGGAMIKAILLKMYGLPVNYIGATFRQAKEGEIRTPIVKDYSFDELAIEKEDVIALNSLVSEVAMNVFALSAKIGIAYLGAMFLHDDEEEEDMYKTNVVGKKEYNPQFMRQELNDPLLEKAYYGLSNLVDEMLDTGVMVTDPSQMLDVLGRRNALYSRVDDMLNVNNSVAAYLNGEDVTLSGYNEGESKLGNRLGKMLALPKFMTDKQLGVENMLVRDFTPGKGPDTWFDTDMKSDYEFIRRQRKILSNKVREELKEEYDYDNQNKYDQAQIDKKIKKYLELEFKENMLNYPMRDDYNDDQSRK